MSKFENLANYIRSVIFHNDFDPAIFLREEFVRINAGFIDRAIAKIRGRYGKNNERL